jgi:hypothetical protein
MGATEAEILMGHIEIHTEDGWVPLEDVPMFDTVNCQLCNEPTTATDIVADIVIKGDQLSVGAWQCRKCKAVNG